MNEHVHGARRVKQAGRPHPGPLHNLTERGPVVPSLVSTITDALRMRWVRKTRIPTSSASDPCQVSAHPEGPEQHPTGPVRDLALVPVRHEPRTDRFFLALLDSTPPEKVAECWHAEAAHTRRSRSSPVHDGRDREHQVLWRVHFVDDTPPRAAERPIARESP